MFNLFRFLLLVRPKMRTMHAIDVATQRETSGSRGSLLGRSPWETSVWEPPATPNVNVAQPILHEHQLCYPSAAAQATLRLGAWETPVRVQVMDWSCRRLQAFETSTWVSVQDVVLNKLRPSTQPSQPLPELSHFYHNTQEKCLAHVTMVLVGVSRLDTKQMRSRQLASFCQLHKSDQKHMSSQKVFTSRHGLFV